MMVAILIAGAAAAYALLTYRGVAKAAGRDRVVLMSLRVAALAVIVFCLFRPALILKAAVPQQNFLGMLVDDSRSMQITDRQSQPRSEFVRHTLAQPDSPLLKALSQRFVLRFFRFSSSAERVESAADLKYAGTATRLGPALARARDELAGLPLAGLVMVTDGADTSDASLDESLASMKARSIPVFAVGVGAERFARDVQVTRVETPRTALKGTSLVVNVVVTQTGYAGATVPLEVEDNGRIVSTQEITLPPDGESATVRVRFTTSDAGPRVFKFRVPQQKDEQVAQNNTREALVEVSDRREKILYFEGEPRFEANFIRRATKDDKNLQVVLLQRTAEDKYLRLNVSTPDELVGGFPKTREELFAYRGVILGSVDGRLVHAGAAPHARRFRQQARRRADDARRAPIVRRRRLDRHAARRSPARRDRGGPEQAADAVLLGSDGPADAGRRRRLRSPKSPATRRRRPSDGTRCRR